MYLNTSLFAQSCQEKWKLDFFSTLFLSGVGNELERLPGCVWGGGCSVFNCYRLFFFALFCSVFCVFFVLFCAFMFFFFFSLRMIRIGVGGNRLLLNLTLD